ncbi:hypothetical protein CCACVL1_15281 [Corchorus capsularis]|uniref:PUM-HD domain-containing protein n=1 Tax=Corchorus capsularis TaxID=210143 RepID=A0A1R3I2W6_COCAP|nr:hypothetical protein CCACVL1_15281 [Corchorus capsularis]
MEGLASRSELRKEVERERRRIRDRQRRQSMSFEEREKHLARRRRNYQLRRQRAETARINPPPQIPFQQTTISSTQLPLTNAQTVISDISPQVNTGAGSAAAAVVVGSNREPQRLMLDTRSTQSLEIPAHKLAILPGKVRLNRIKHLARVINEPASDGAAKGGMMNANGASNCLLSKGLRLNRVKRLARSLNPAAQENNTMEKKEKSVYSASESQNSYNLSLSFGSLCLSNAGVENNSAFAYSADSVFGFPCNGSLRGNMNIDGRQSCSFDGNRAGETMSKDRASAARDYLFGNNSNSLSGVAAHRYSTSPLSCPKSQPVASANGGNSGGFQRSLNPTDHLLRKNTIFRSALTENGSKQLQHLLSLKEPSIINKIFEGVIKSIFELMTINQHGHSLFAQLIKSCSDDQLRIIMKRLTADPLVGNLIVTTSRTLIGSYSIMKLIEVLKRSPLIFKVITALQAGFFLMMISENGSRVIYKCLDVLDTRTNEFLYVAAKCQCLNLAVHEHGCLSLINFIDKMRGQHRFELLHVIAKHSLHLSQNPSGNYVVQKVVELDNPYLIEEICCQLKGHIAKLSLQKGGSHVVERMLNSRGMHQLAIELLESNNLLHVAQHRYGNYVVQVALNASKRAGSPIYQQLMKKLERYLHCLQYGYARNVYNLIKPGVAMK